VFARITKDLNSPSAAARIRANRALKSPNFKRKVYEQFDVAHEMQDIITEEERLAPVGPKSIREVFANCKVYVEVRTGEDNRSEGIKIRLHRDGITVNEKLYKDTTHVIFKDGLLSTYRAAKKLGIPVTTILWMDACIAQRRLVDTDKFKISNLERYERPELFKRLRREKSMQPTLTKSTGKQFRPVLDRSFSQDDKRDDPKKHETVLGDEMELTLQNQTEVEKSEDEKWKEHIRRLTTFTPNPMEQTGVNRRRTMFAQNSEDSSTSGASNNTVIFNSSNRISKFSRRSGFDISMNILEMNCKTLCYGDEVFSTPKEQEQHQPLQTQEAKPVQVRKRKLFNNDDYEQEDEQKENLNDSTRNEKKKKLDKSLGLVAEGWKTPTAGKTKKETIKRRETIAFFKSKETVKAKTPVKPQAVAKVIVCTNMSSADKQIINAVSSFLLASPCRKSQTFFPS
jgi:hypothetical protein